MRSIVLATILLVCILALPGCGTQTPALTSVTTLTRSTTAGPADAGNTAGTLDPEAAVTRAIRRIEAVLELPAGSVTRRSGETGLSSEDIMLGWTEGHAEVDPNGRVVMILFGSNTAHPKISPSAAELDRAATHYVEQLGWDSKSLKAEGFTTTETTTYDRGDAPTEFTKRWAGHDETNLPNGGLIEVALDVSTGKLLRFFYHPGPRAAAGAASTVSKDEAVSIARQTVGDDPPADPTTTQMLPNGAATTGPSLGLVVASAELVHSDAPGITGGKDMLIWIVKLSGYTRSGYAHPTVYIDAVTGKVLQETY
jgi:hypothetical protein